jgi:hypothetical protein
MIKGIKKSLLLIMCATAFQLCAEPEQFKKEIKELLASAKALKGIDPVITLQLHLVYGFLLKASNFNIKVIEKDGMNAESLSQRYKFLKKKFNQSFKVEDQDNSKPDLPAHFVGAVLARLCEEEEHCLQVDKEQQSKCAKELNEFVRDEFTALKQFLNTPESR